MTTPPPPYDDRLAGVLRAVAHKLRQPAFALNLYATLLNQDDADPEAREDTGAGVLEVSEGLNAVVDALVELAALADHPVSPSTVSLADLVDDRWAAHRPDGGQLTRSGLGAIDADVELITLVVDEVVANACRHGGTADSPVTLTVTASQTDGGHEVRFADQGSGVPPEEIERIFRPFVSLNSRLPGAGLGLSLARMAAQRLGGDIVCERAEPGVVFVLTLPAVVPPRPSTR